MFIPAEDGGYVLVGLHQAESRLFEDVAWGGPTVMAQTRSQLHACALTWSELSVHWDLDRPEDLPRLSGSPGLFVESGDRCIQRLTELAQLHLWKILFGTSQKCGDEYQTLVSCILFQVIHLQLAV